MTIRVLLADDQALLRGTFRLLIDSCADMQVVGEATNGQEAVELVQTHHPDVVLMDIRMPGTDGLAATTTICDDPDLAGTRILILIMFETYEYVAKALRAGASGFLGKYVTTDALLAGIRTVASGEALLSPGATRAFITRFLTTPGAQDTLLAPPERLQDLTPREREVTALAAEGKSNAETLFLSVLTVRTHIQRAITKLGARDRAQLVVIAYQTGLVQPTPPA
ncbi:two component transcriptional regulator, LuxR family [Streptomyces sp. cf386]|uniref:response regulator transcription factor n=1 Tax=Streptomyces sp. cf386 TaxID=1761904 RepID=UPI000880988E|nr:response regulator transcription factor [Streptomyces sp. cf386]SDM75993.1 two component transcriptional regulator, LuxR family [Streptomyces sp. cf386]